MKTDNKSCVQVESNLGLVHMCCKKFVSKGFDYDELFSAGCYGLVKASKGFKSDMGVKFSTYAVPVILGEIKQLFRNGGTIKVGRRLQELSIKINDVKILLNNRLNREPTIKEIADELNENIETVSEAICSTNATVSIQNINPDGEEYNLEPTVESFQDSFCNKTAVRQLLNLLDVSERKIVYLRYYEEKTQQYVADYLGMTQVQVSRKEKQILKKLKKYLE